MRKTPVVLGVLSIIFGSVMAVSSVVTALMGPLFQKLGDLTRNLPGQTELQRAQMEASSDSFAHMTPYLTTSSIIYAVMSIALVVVGVGLCRRRALARRATICWAGLALTLTVANAVYMIAWMQPQQRQVQRTVYAAHGVTIPFELPSGVQTGMVLASALLYAAYPTVLLALIARRSASRDFLQKSPTAAS